MTATDLDDTCTVPKSRSEQDIGVREQSFFQRNDNKLTTLESVAEELTNVLSVLQVKSGVNFVKNVHRGGFELKKGHDKREGDE